MEVVYRAKKFEIIKEIIELPNKRRHEIEYLNHRGSSVILPVEGESVYLIRQYRPIIRKEIYELPAGTIEEGETPLETAIRELEEEVGLKAEELTELARFFPSPGISNETMYLFLARKLRKVERRPEPYEVIEVEKFKVNYVRQLINRGEIEDGKTLIGLFFLLYKTLL